MGFGTSRGLQRAGRLAAAAALGSLLVAAAPARAGGDFEDGFEDELGRLMAREVVRLGHFVLGGGYGHYAHYPFYAAPHHPRPHPHPVWRPHRPVAQPLPAHRPPVYTQPCDHPSHAVPRYGEHIVYERYERTVTPPPVRSDAVAHPAGYRY